MKPEPSASVDAAGKPSQERSRRARSHLGRSFVPLIAAAVVLCVLVIWQRDRRHIEAARHRISETFEPVAAYLEAHGTLPLDFPYDLLENPSRAFTYAEPEMIRWALRSEDPVVIGYGKGEGLIARPNGHAVMIYDKGRLRDDWLSRSALEEQLDRQQVALESGGGG